MTSKTFNRLSPLPDRLWAKVMKTDSCWLWTGGDNGHGYGQIGLGNRKFYVHRVAYELLVGPIPDGLQIDHTCMVRNCVNPEHLEPVTPQVNVRRSSAPVVNGAWQRARTHCPVGHPYSDDNTYVNPSGSRNCRTCKKEWDRQRREAAPREPVCAHPNCGSRSWPGQDYCRRPHVFDDQLTKEQP